MAFLQIPTAKQTYNWDDIDVGNLSLDHSQNFFANQHLKHEKLHEIDILNAQMVNTVLNDSFEATNDLQNDNKENKNLNIKLEVNESVAENKNLNIKLEVNESVAENKLKTNAVTLKAEVPSISQEAANKILEETVKDKPAVAILTCWSTQRPIVRDIIKPNGIGCKENLNMPRTPKVYGFKEVYQRKKLDREQQRIEEERKLREFHSRPVPNFRALHERLNKKTHVHELTEPITPKTLQIAQQTRQKKEEMRRRCLLEEMTQQQQQQRNKSQSYPPKVLLKEPFVPKKPGTIVQSCPFQLQSEKRALERRQFDTRVQRALEEKGKQEEEERKKQEEETTRKLKLLATFKARPNPFK